MKWARDNAVLGRNEGDLSRVFKFEPRESLVIKVMRDNKFKIQIWSLQTDSDWTEWIRTECSENFLSPGLALILAKRPGEKPTGATPSKEMSYTEWLETVRYDASAERRHRIRQIFAPLSEKGVTKDKRQPMQPGVRKVPFSANTFKSICEKFHVHDYILKTIARTDTPSFFCEEVNMSKKAKVYNCRTPNEWPNDMAMSLTYFPETTTSFAILYGCTNSIERSMLDMLSKVNTEVYHPMLVPGIFAELELARHIGLVSASIVDVETKILELDTDLAAIRTIGQAAMERKNESKRTSWLDLAYLRNSITTWNDQLTKMSLEAARPTRMQDHSWDHRKPTNCSIGSLKDTDEALEHINPAFAGVVSSGHIARTGNKIAGRLVAIHEEYEEKIRDCTMRLDGMAMATQWSHSETAVGMALATNWESRVMKSISLVTMIFLPGTFFATVFSMSFFNWFGSDGKTQVSRHLWIYVAATACFTLLTVGMWYFFVIYHRPHQKLVDKEG